MHPTDAAAAEGKQGDEEQKGDDGDDEDDLKVVLGKDFKITHDIIELAKINTGASVGAEGLKEYRKMADNLKRRLGQVRVGSDVNFQQSSLTALSLSLSFSLSLSIATYRSIDLSIYLSTGKHVGRGQCVGK